MAKKAQTRPKSALHAHCIAVKEGRHRFENAFQGVTRMILENSIEKVVVNAKTTYDFSIFRNGAKHIIGMYDELNSFVSYVKDAAENGSSKEMAYVLVGEPGNGKTFFVEFLCAAYRSFLSLPGNRKFTFRFNDMAQLGHYGRITAIESQTYEDPMILAMNLHDDPEENRRFLLKRSGSTRAPSTSCTTTSAPWGPAAATYGTIFGLKCDGDLDKMLSFIDIIPVPLTESLGTVTGKYPAKDKITSSAVDLLGEESIQRLLHITDTNNPYRFDLRRGALARVAGGGIHFSRRNLQKQERSGPGLPGRHSEPHHRNRRL
jgi:serine protein kinase